MIDPSQSEFLLQDIQLKLQFLGKSIITFVSVRAYLQLSRRMLSWSPSLSSFPFVFLKDEDDDLMIVPVCGLCEL